MHSKPEMATFGLIVKSRSESPCSEIGGQQDKQTNKQILLIKHIFLPSFLINLFSILLVATIVPDAIQSADKILTYKALHGTRLFERRPSQITSQKSAREACCICPICYGCHPGQEPFLW